MKREEIRRQKLLAKKQQEEEKKLEQKIALEERKILIAQRKLESMRLLEELFNRVKVVVAQEEMEKREKELSVEREKRLIEEASLEQAKRIKIEQEVTISYVYWVINRLLMDRIFSESYKRLFSSFEDVYFPQ